MTASDEELLSALRDALMTNDAHTPSQAEMARFHEAAALGRAGAGVGPRAGRGAMARARLRWEVWRALPPWPSPALVGAAAVLGVFGVFGGAVAANALPGPLRSVAYDVGLPVSSPALEAAEAAESALQGAISSRDRPAIQSDVTVLRQRLSVLDASDRATADPKARRLLSDALALLVRDTSTTTTPGSTTSSTSNAGTTAGSSGGTTSTPSTTGVVVAPPPDDSGGSGTTTEPTDTTEPASTKQSLDTSGDSTSGSTDKSSSDTGTSSSSSDSTPTTSSTPTTADGSSSSTDN